MPQKKKHARAPRAPWPTCSVCGKKFNGKSDATLCKEHSQEKVVSASTEQSPYKYAENLKRFEDMGLDRVEWLSTGISSFDELTKIPRGRVTQIQGPYAVGKTTLALNMVAGMKRTRTLYIDTEASLSPALLAALQVEPDYFKLYNDSAFIEDIYDLIIPAVKSNDYDLIIFDSLAACTFRNEAEGIALDANIGQKAKVVNKLMRILPMELKATKTALVIINQEREVIGSRYPVKYTPGGMGVVYAASLMISLKSNKVDRFMASKEGAGQIVHATIIKSKVSEPWREAAFKIYYPTSYETSQYNSPEEA